VSPSAGTTQKAAILRRLAGAARALLAATGQIGRCIFDENHAFLTFTAWQRISYEAQRIDCVVIAESTCTECSFCIHRSGLDSELHSEFEDSQGVKECKTHL